MIFCEHCEYPITDRDKGCTNPVCQVNLEKYPSIANYSGGGTILNGHTSIRNLHQTALEQNISFDELVTIILQGNEVIVLGGEIKAVGPY